MRKILIVDDMIEVAEMMALYLRKKGYEVHTASNGKVALEIVLAHQEVPYHGFDMVITDREMPVMTGDELVAELRQRTLGLKIIVVSSLMPESDLGCDCFYMKPIDMDELIDRIRDLLFL